MVVSMIISPTRSRSENTVKTWNVGNGVGFRDILLVCGSGISALASFSDHVGDLHVCATEKKRLCPILGEK